MRTITERDDDHLLHTNIRKHINLNKNRGVHHEPHRNLLSFSTPLCPVNCVAHSNSRQKRIFIKTNEEELPGQNIARESASESLPLSLSVVPLVTLVLLIISITYNSHKLLVDPQTRLV